MTLKSIQEEFILNTWKKRIHKVFRKCSERIHNAHCARTENKK